MNTKIKKGKGGEDKKRENMIIRKRRIMLLCTLSFYPFFRTSIFKISWNSAHSLKRRKSINRHLFA